MSPRFPSACFAIVLAALFAFAGAACSEDKGLRIEKIQPRQGPPHGGDWITISGNGFQQGARNVKVYFNETPASQVTIVSDDEIKVLAPAGPEGKSVDLHIIFEDGRDKKFPQAYTYIEEKRLDVNDLVGGKKDE